MVCLKPLHLSARKRHLYIKKKNFLIHFLFIKIIIIVVYDKLVIIEFHFLIIYFGLPEGMTRTRTAVFGPILQDLPFSFAKRF